MKPILFTFAAALLFITIYPILTYSQTYNSFKWNTENVSFKTTQMNVFYPDPKTSIFNGYKEASVSIKQKLTTSTTDVVVSVKFAEYFEIKEGVVTSFEYKVKEHKSTITYEVMDGNQLLLLVISYDEIAGKPIQIAAATVKDIMDKKSKTLRFILTSFE